MGKPLPLFHLFLVFSNKQYKSMEKCPSSIRRRDLNPRPLEHERSPITTRPVLFLQKNIHAEMWLQRLWMCFFLKSFLPFDCQCWFLCRAKANEPNTLSLSVLLASLWHSFLSFSLSSLFPLSMTLPFALSLLSFFSWSFSELFLLSVFGGYLDTNVWFGGGDPALTRKQKNAFEKQVIFYIYLSIIDSCCCRLYINYNL